jgi:uncharacterized lipoprotein YddW (UPF0748 family)
MFRSLILGLALWMASLPSFSQSIETRVIFDEDFNWLTPETANKTLQRIKDAGFNVFVPVVWHGRGVSWPSKLAPKEPLWEQEKESSKDPLGYLIKQAHALGIEVHPWFTVALRQRNFFKEFCTEGTPAEAFDVHDLSFQKFFASLVEEVIKNYDVDGINLDYIRSMGICVSTSCEKNYREKLGRKLENDVAALEISESAKRSLIAWNSDAISNIVLSIKKTITKTKPTVVLSTDSLVGSEPWRLQGADSIFWANQGWVDIVYHMDYSPLEKIDRLAISRAQRLLRNPEKFILLVGNYETSKDKIDVWPRKSHEVVNLLAFARKLRLESPQSALYEYRFFGAEQARLIRERIFTTFSVPRWRRPTNPSINDLTKIQ